MTARFLSDWRKRDIIKELRERGDCTDEAEKLRVNEIKSKYLKRVKKQGRSWLYEVEGEGSV